MTTPLKEIEDSLTFLGSDEALKMLEADPYWPKWHSPWWHMLLLHEMGETKKIPQKTIDAFIKSMNKYPLKIFPIQPEDMPEGIDPYRGTPCHCQLGNVYQVLAAYGVDVDDELPWIRPWFLRYQMSDGGLTCDNDAYLVEGECPSSMVGTIAAFEAVLLYTPREWTSQEKAFLDRGAKFLIDRKLMYGSKTKHNASEQESAKDWIQLCFPRYYFYDVLRGLNALLLWAKKTKQTIPRDAILPVLTYLNDKFPEGQMRIERQSFIGNTTIQQTTTGEWIRKQPATHFPLLDKVSAVGQISPYLKVPQI